MENGQTQTVTASPTPPIDKPVEAKNTKIITIALIAALVATLISTGFLAYKNMQLTKEIASMKNQNLVPPTYVSPAPIATTDPTASWSMVQTTNWSFKIPGDWNYFTCNGKDGYVSADLASSMTKISVTNHLSECNFDYQGLFTVSRQTSPYTIPTTPPVIPTDNPNVDSVFYTQVTDKKDIQVGGKTATYQTEVQHGGQGAGSYIRVYIVNGSNTDVITLTDTYQKQTFDQILSTFKFNN